MADEIEVKVKEFLGIVEVSPDAEVVEDNGNGAGSGEKKAEG